MSRSVLGLVISIGWYVWWLIVFQRPREDFGFMALLIAMVITLIAGMAASPGALVHEEERKHAVERTARRGTPQTEIFDGD